MSFRIERNDITKVRADAIVNTANPEARIGRGTDSAIFEAAGADELLKARKAIGNIEPGSSVYTSAFSLSSHGVKYIIHTAGFPYINGNSGEDEILRNCYRTSLNLAKKLKCQSVALPLLASGNYGYPKDLAFKIAVEEINSFLIFSDDDFEMEVILIVYDRTSFRISELLYGEVEDYLEENKERPAKKNRAICSIINSDTYFETFDLIVEDKKPSNGSYNYIGKNLDDFLKNNKSMDFKNTLQKMIADRGLSNAFVYKKANLKKQYFSDIINPKNDDYVPKKNAVLSLGLALELPLNDFESFLSTAGYSLKGSSTFDMIVKYCVMKKKYNIIEVNLILYDRLHKTLDVSSK